MPKIKAVITDYIGTLTIARFYTMEASMMKLHAALSEAGFATVWHQFQEAYSKAHEKYKIIRYSELREVTNSVWVSEALCSLGRDVKADNPCMKAALNIFFKDYVESLEKRPFADTLLKKSQQTMRVGLISNFTYAPVVYSSMRQLGLSKYFNTIVVSDDCGWRKPHPKIFEYALSRLQVKPREAVYIGDCPAEDIKGAKDAGMLTIFVKSQFYSRSDLDASHVKPDFTAENLKEVDKHLSEICS